MNETTQRYNLIFSGKLKPGTDRVAARATLAYFFGLKDPGAVEGFFSGRPVPLRRALPRAEALHHYRKLRAVGLICELTEVRQNPAVSERSQSTVASDAGKPTPRGAAKTVADAGPQAKAPSRTLGPNLFALRPTPSGRHLPKERESAQLRALIAGVAAVALGVIVLAVSLRFPAAPAGAMPQGPLAAAALPDNGLALLLPGALLIHERSGLPRRRVNAFELGLRSLAPPLVADGDGSLLLNGDAGAGMTLQRCSLEELLCMPLLAEAVEVTAMASSYLGDRRFLLTAAGEILLTSVDGRIINRAPGTLPQGYPRLLASDGLLLIPADDGPLLGVYRPDEKEFAQQLDALLLMPQEAVLAGHNRIRDVALGDEYRWSLLSADDGSHGLYRFTRQWGEGVAVALSRQLNAPYLATWRDKILVASPTDQRMLRFAADGNVEADFESAMLKNLSDEWHEQVRQRALLRQGGVILPLAIAALSLLVALLYYAQHQALSRLPGQPTALLDPMPGGIHWRGPHDDRHRQANRLGLLITAVAILPVLLLALSGAGTVAIVMLPAVIGSVLCWTSLHGGTGGFIGLHGEHIIAVDHDGHYFYGEQSLLRSWGNWVLAPGIAIPLRLGPLTNIDGNPGDDGPSPATPASCTVIALLGMLWRRGHPWIHGALYLLGGWLISLVGILLLVIP